GLRSPRRVAARDVVVRGATPFHRCELHILHRPLLGGHRGDHHVDARRIGLERVWGRRILRWWRRWGRRRFLVRRFAFVLARIVRASVAVPLRRVIRPRAVAVRLGLVIVVLVL